MSEAAVPPAAAGRGWTWALAAVLLAAAAIRLARPGVIDFDGDLAGRVTHARAVARGDERPLIGRELSGLVDRGRHGPAMSYWDAIPFLFTDSPRAIAWFTALCHLVGVWATWRLGRETIGPACGLAGALLVATHPFFAYWTRILNNASYLPLWFPLLYLFLWRSVSRPRSPWIAAFVVTLAVASQFHLLILNILPAALLAALVFRPPISWRWLGLGALGTELVYLPIPVYGVLTHDWDVVLGWKDILSSGRVGGGALDPARALTPFSALTWGHPYFAFAPARLGGLQADACHLASRILTALAVVGVAALTAQAIRSVGRMATPGGGAEQPELDREVSRGAAFLLISITVECAALLTIRSTFYDRYLHAVYPLLMLAAGAGPELAARRLRGRASANTLRGAGIGLALAIGCVLTWGGATLLESVHQRGLILGDLPSLERQEQLARSLVGEFGVRSAADAVARVTTFSGDTWGLLPLIDDVAGARPSAAARGDLVPRDWAIRIELEPRGSTADAALVVKPAWARRRFPPLEALAYPPRMLASRIRVRPHPESDGWIEPSFDDAEWEKWTPLWTGVAAHRDLAVRVPLHVDRPTEAATVVLASRGCVERAWLDGTLVRSATCPRERREVEVDRDLTRIPIAPPEISAGEHLLALDVVVRDKWYDVQIFDEAPLDAE